MLILLNITRLPIWFSLESLNPTFSTRWFSGWNMSKYVSKIPHMFPQFFFRCLPMFPLDFLHGFPVFPIFPRIFSIFSLFSPFFPVFSPFVPCFPHFSFDFLHFFSICSPFFLHFSLFFPCFPQLFWRLLRPQRLRQRHQGAAIAAHGLVHEVLAAAQLRRGARERQAVHADLGGRNLLGDDFLGEVDPYTLKMGIFQFLGYTWGWPKGEVNPYIQWIGLRENLQENSMLSDLWLWYGNFHYFNGNLKNSNDFILKNMSSSMRRIIPYSDLYHTMVYHQPGIDGYHDLGILWIFQLLGYTWNIQRGFSNDLDMIGGWQSIMVPSGKLWRNYGKIHHFIAKSTISMVISNSYVSLPEGNDLYMILDIVTYTLW